ncbi:MAG: acyltransferase family protein, partial [Cyanobacteria bacterium P01_C01_bin.118]
MPPLSAADKSAAPLKTSVGSGRLPWLDAAKAYGILLVYYGHFVERISDLQGLVGGTAAFAQYEFIYGFHMPLFFVLSGFVYKDKGQTTASFVRHRLLTRIVPVIFFNFLAIGVLSLGSAVTGNPIYTKHIQDTNVLIDMLSGYPTGNFSMWFLCCLFTTELFNHWAQPLLGNSSLKRAAAAVVTLVMGHYLGIYQSTLTNFPLQGFNTWFFTSALIGFSFYQMGFILKRSKLLEVFQRSFYPYVALGIALVAAVALSDLNQGPFVGDRNVVIMAGVSHGSLLPFTMMAIMGSLLVICLSLCISSNRLITFVGQNTLILLGLNIFFAGFTKPLVGQIGLTVFDAWWAVLLFCTALTLISLAVSVPVI